MESRAVTLRDSDYCASQDDGERVQSCVATASQTATSDEQRNRLVKRSLRGKRSLAGLLTVILDVQLRETELELASFMLPTGYRDQNLRRIPEK